MYLIPQGSTQRVEFMAFLASDGKTPATGKTIAITISKNGGAFANPNAGATNATAIGNGWYYVDLNATDTNTLGPLAIRGAEGTIDDVGFSRRVVNANNAGLAALPNAAAEAAGGIYTRGTGAGQINQPANGRIDSNVVAMANNVLTAAATANDFATDLRAALGMASGDLDTQLAALAASLADIPTNAELATALAAADDAVLAAVAALNNLSTADLVNAIAELPTNTELAAALSAADDAILGAIGSLQNVSVAQILTTQMTESYAANGAAPTLAQALFAIHQYLMQFAIAGTMYSVKRLNNNDEAFAVTLNDAESPTAAARA